MLNCSSGFYHNSSLKIFRSFAQNTSHEFFDEFIIFFFSWGLPEFFWLFPVLQSFHLEVHCVLAPTLFEIFSLFFREFCELFQAFLPEILPICSSFSLDFHNSCEVQSGVSPSVFCDSFPTVTLGNFAEVLPEVFFSRGVFFTGFLLEVFTVPPLIYLLFSRDYSHYYSPRYLSFSQDFFQNSSRGFSNKSL